MTLKKKIFLVSIFILLQIGNGLLLEELTESGISGHMLLLGRSSIALVLSIATALFLKKNIFPNKPSTQVIRLVFSGLGLFLITVSYKYISAASVATFQRADIPIIILITLLMGKTKSLDKFILMTASFLTITSIIILSSSIDESPTGYYLALSGVFLLSVSNFFVKKTAEQENFFVFINTACISCIVIGVFVGLYNQFELSFTTKQILGLALSGIFMFGLYLSILEFYRHYSLEKAQYPAMLAAFLTMFGEMILEQKWFSPLFISLNILLLVIITATIRAK